MSISINGFYGAYLTGSAGQGFAMLIFKDGVIIGVDASGVKYDGTYAYTENGYSIKLNVAVPANTLLVQGVNSGPQIDNSEIDIQLPLDFLSQPFVRIDGKHGPVNAKIIKLRELNE
jgi:hypothetical protein